MKNTFISFRATCILCMTGILGFLIIESGCEKYPDPPPYFEKYDSSQLNVTQRKVLIINIEGAIGAEVATIKPPEIESLLDHSKYCWKGATEAGPTDASTLESLFTGTAEAKHQITDSSFQFQVPEGTDEVDMPPFYPTFFTYVLASEKADLVTTSIVPWNILNEKLLPVVQNRVTVTDDKAVADSAVSHLKSGVPDLMFVDFNSVNIAGATNGYGAGVPAYKAAVLKVDGYIKNIMGALKTRPEYNKKEDWLVIVTSNIGGAGPIEAGYPTPTRNTFSLYYNENFKSLEFEPLYTNAVEMKGGMSDALPPPIPYDYAKFFEGKDLVNAINTGSEEEQSKYDVGNTNQISIQFKVRSTNPKDASYYPPIVSKLAARAGTNAGWCFYRNAQNIVFWFGTGAQNVALTIHLFDDSWHTVTGTVIKRDNKYTIKAYVDGAFKDSAQTSKDELTASEESVFSPYPLSLGYWPYTYFYGSYPSSNEFFQDLRIWNEALPDKAIADNSCKGELTSSDPYFSKLVGNWPCNEGQGDSLLNTIPGGPGFEINGNYSWKLLSPPDLPCSFTIGDNNRGLNNLDVFPQVFYWLNIGISDDWGLAGKVWLDAYEQEFIKVPQK